MTRIESREQHISRWTALLQEAQTSGLTIKEWCKSKGAGINLSLLEAADPSEGSQSHSGTIPKFTHRKPNPMF